MLLLPLTLWPNGLEMIRLKTVQLLDFSRGLHYTLPVGGVEQMLEQRLRVVIRILEKEQPERTVEENAELVRIFDSYWLEERGIGYLDGVSRLPPLNVPLDIAVVRSKMNEKTMLSTAKIQLEVVKGLKKAD